MTQWLVENSNLARLCVFIIILSSMVSAELLWPRRELMVLRRLRWPNNLGLVALNTLLLRLLFSSAAVGAAHFAQEQGFGFFNYYNSLPLWLGLVGTVVFLDFVIYFQHLLFHFVPALWRLHLVHHTDLDLDVTSGSRFHPIEIILSLLIKMTMVLLIGAPVAGVILFEIILNGAAMFNHSNVKLPKTLDKYLRWFLVTPDMHRVHHSIDPKETNTNFGFNLPWWDRIFGTYKDQPLMGHENMFIGLTVYRKPQEVSPLLKMLSLPFRKDPERIDQ